jgi:DNA repair exonuclease SbcCD ATPase subunit
MNLLRCHILGFGKLANRSVSFQNGLNLAFAPNEGGKSTLQRFLLAMLYGQLRPDLRTQRRLEPWVEDFKPWNGGEYGGTLWCGVASGREFELRRTFGKDEARIEVRTSTGEEITLSYEQQRNGEVLFARAHLGLPKDLFEAIAIIRENRVAELNSRENLRDRIANLAQSGIEEHSMVQSLGRLEAALELIGSERAPTRPYRQTQESIEALQAEKRNLEMRRLEFESWVADRSRLAAELQDRERQFQAARSISLNARWREAADKVRILEELEADLQGLRSEIEASDGRPDFPAHELDDLNRLVGAKESIDKRLADSAKELEAAGSRLLRAETDRAALGAYAGLVESNDADKITEWFVKYMGTAFHRDEALRSLNQAKEEIVSLEDSLSGLGPSLSNPLIDWERCAREASEKERVGSEQILIVTQRLADQKDALVRLRRRTAKRGALAGAAILLAIAALAAWRFLGPQQVPGPPAFAIAAALALGGVVGFAAALKSRALEHPVEQQIETLEADRTRWRDESVKASRELREAMDSSGIKTVEEFLDAAKLAGLYRQQLQQLRSRIKGLEDQREKTIAESSDYYTRLNEALGKVGLQCSPGIVKTQVDILRVNLRRFRELDNTFRNSQRQADDLRAQSGELAREADENAARIRAILDRARVESADAFRAASLKRQRLLELTERESLRRREFQRLCGKRNLEQWKEQLRELEHWKDRSQHLARTAQPPPAGAESVEPDTPLLPYLPGVSEAEEEERRVAGLLAAAREEHARVAERVSQAFLNFRSISEIEEDLAQAEQTFEGLRRNREALEVALETMRTLAREQQEVLAPQLNFAVEQRFLRLCDGRYQEVKVDPDLQIWVRESTNSELRPSEALSRGTQDQLYFALRFAMLDLLAAGDEPCPALLDEPFAAYDRGRLEEAFRILQEESARRQLMLFTCREDLRDLALVHGAHLLQLTDDQGL